MIWILISITVDHDTTIESVSIYLDDLEMAMREEQAFGNSGEGGIGIKHTKIVKEHDGLRPGDLIPPYAWSWLKDSNGSKADFSQAHKNSSDIVVLISDPRRMNNEYKLVLDQFNKIPKAKLKVELAAVNCDDFNDLKKLTKKMTYTSYTVFSDTSKKVNSIRTSFLIFKSNSL